MVGIAASRSWSCVSNSNPSMRGMFRSVNITCGSKVSSFASASNPSTATSVLQHCDRRRSDNKLRSVSSSSTIRTLGAFLWRHGGHKMYFDAEHGWVHLALDRLADLRREFPNDGQIEYCEALFRKDFLGQGAKAEELFLKALRADRSHKFAAFNSAKYAPVVGRIPAPSCRSSNRGRRRPRPAIIQQH